MGLIASAAFCCLFLFCLGCYHILIYKNPWVINIRSPSLLYHTGHVFKAQRLSEHGGSLVQCQRVGFVLVLDLSVVSCVKIPHGCSDWSCLSPPPSVEASDWATVSRFQRDKSLQHSVCVIQYWRFIKCFKIKFLLASLDRSCQSQFTLPSPVHYEYNYSLLWNSTTLFLVAG